MSFTGLANKDAPGIRTLVTRETAMACRLSFLGLPSLLVNRYLPEK